jgi:hypothetical protein
VIIRGCRFDLTNQPGSGTSQWGVMIGGSYNSGAINVHDVVFDHNTILGANDDQLATGDRAYNITTSWNLMYHSSSQNQIQDGFAHSQSHHHNFYAPYAWRNPYIQYNFQDGETPTSTGVTADVRNNFILSGSGLEAGNGTILSILCSRGAKCNIINNYWIGKNNFTHPTPLDFAVAVYGTSQFPDSPTGQRSNSAWSDGNVVVSDYDPAWTWDPNTDLTATEEFSTASVTTTSAEQAACDVIAQAGAFPRLVVEQDWADEEATELAKFHTC